MGHVGRLGKGTCVCVVCVWYDLFGLGRLPFFLLKLPPSLGTKKALSVIACVERDVRYSESHEQCTLNLFHPQTVLPGAPIVVYIHGGYWCKKILEHSGGWFAPMLTSTSGCSVAAIEYGLCDRVPLDEAVRHVRCAIAFLHRRYPTWSHPYVLEQTEKRSVCHWWDAWPTYGMARRTTRQIGCTNAQSSSEQPTPQDAIQQRSRAA